MLIGTSRDHSNISRSENKFCLIGQLQYTVYASAKFIQVSQEIFCYIYIHFLHTYYSKTVYYTEMVLINSRSITSARFWNAIIQHT